MARSSSAATLRHASVMPTTATRTEYVGIFLVAMATLMFEILLTRIFSVTLWAHLAFVAVSVAMFGMTLGAVLVYLFSAWFTPARARLNLALSSALFGVTAVWSLDFHLRSAIDPVRDHVAAVAAGACLRRHRGPVRLQRHRGRRSCSRSFPLQISRLYAADLAGAACGCVLLITVARSGGRTANGVRRRGGRDGRVARLPAQGVEGPLRGCGGVDGRGLIVSGLSVRRSASRSTGRCGSSDTRKGSAASQAVSREMELVFAHRGRRPTFERPFGWGLSDTLPASRRRSTSSA